eukprot:2060586-Lingulodinium_polyedra.AAC.1
MIQRQSCRHHRITQDSFLILKHPDSIAPVVVVPEMGRMCDNDQYQLSYPVARSRARVVHEIRALVKERTPVG